jgi:hypothetical protein
MPFFDGLVWDISIAIAAQSAHQAALAELEVIVAER